MVGGSLNIYDWIGPWGRKMESVGAVRAWVATSIVVHGIVDEQMIQSSGFLRF